MSAQTYPVGFHDARLSVPTPSKRALERDRITQRLDVAVRSRPVMLVTGAGGTGKTYAVALWSRSQMAFPEPLDVAWATLDRADRDPHRFWVTVVGALRAVPDAEALLGLAVPFRPNQYFVDSLTAALAQVCRPIVLVLDDVHEITGSPALKFLQQLQRAMPGHHRLVLISREEPMLHLHRLRLAGDLGEMRSAELAFTPTEAAQLLREGGLDLSGEMLDHLMARTEGWAAALRLATIAITPGGDPAMLRQFGGHHALVSAYLHEEILAGLSPDRADFLMRTSIVERICGPLAHALTQEPSSSAVLESLVADNLLVSALDENGWYSYHPMMVEMLHARLRAEAPELVVELHRRAQRWFEEAGEWLEALRHAFLAGDQAGGTQLALRSAVLAFTPERARLVQVLEAQLGGPLTTADPERQVCRALVAHCVGNDDAARAWASRAETDLRSLPEPRRGIAGIALLLVLAAQAQRRGDPHSMRSAALEALHLCRRLVPGASTAPYQCRSVAESMVGAAELWLGQPERAKDLLCTSMADLDQREYGGHAYAHRAGLVALSEAVRGQVCQARRRAEAVLEGARASGWSQSHESGAAWLALALTSQLRGDLSEAERCLALARKTQIELHDPLLGAVMSVVAARGAVTAGDVPRARRGLAEVDRWLIDHPRPTVVTVMGAVLRAEIELAVGAPLAAAAALAPVGAQDGESSGSFAMVPDPSAITRGHVLLSTGQPLQALEVVAPLFPAGGAIASEAWLVTALAQDRLRQDFSAMESVTRALAYGEAEGAVQVFLRANDRLPVLLRRHLEVLGPHRVFAARVLTCIEGAAAASPRQVARATGMVALTERELSILAYLATLSTNNEIAEHINISVNTVKQHLKSINRKLEVSSRREAVRAARRRGLLPEVGEQTPA